MKALVLLAALAAPAAAQPVPPVTAAPATCDKASPVRGFEGWERPSARGLVLEQRAELALTPTAQLTLAPPPTRSATAGSFGGAFPLTIGTEGVYRIALSGPAWIEVVRAGDRVASVAHQMGPACSGIRKIVDFRLAPGTYQVQLSGAPAATIGAMVVPAS